MNGPGTAQMKLECVISLWYFMSIKIWHDEVVNNLKIQKEDVHKVAHLARLELSEDESRRLTGDMNNILSYIDKLAELDTEEIEPTSHAVAVTNAFREDVSKDFFTAEEGLSNAPDAEDGSFKVPKVIE